MSDTVLYAVRERVARITLNRPERSNAVDLELSHALSAALDRAAGDSTVDVVILAGAGRLFCAGGDLTAMAAAPDTGVFLAELASAIHGAVRRLHELDKPVVAAVQGAAAGIGLSLTLGADLVIAGDSARFLTAYTSIGLTPDGGLSWLLPRTVGQRRASELLLNSRPLDAEAALGLGIVSDICPDAEVAAVADQAAAALTRRPAHALGATRQLVHSAWEHSFSEHLDREAEAIARAGAHPASRELVARFLSAERAPSGPVTSDPR